jgi:hypothetical protein
MALFPILLALALFAPPNSDKAYEQALVVSLDRAFPGAFGFDQGGMPPPGDRLLFADALASNAFLHQAVGPFDLYVYQADQLAIQGKAQQVLERAAEGLAPLAVVMQRRFGRLSGVLSGRRFPIVLASSDREHGQTGFDGLVALLDWCEADWSDWREDNGSLWTAPLREGLVVRTWEVQLLNLAHDDAAVHGEAFLDHGVGYYTIAHLTHRLLRQGSWGLVPPWLDQGLVDELDIEAYGRAWVGGDWYIAKTAGWFRPGWSGFVPQGGSPPPPVTGPPADLATTVEDSGDAWAHRNNSPTRHWVNLVADLDAEWPASFEFMARNQSFLPRDRAFARCVMHLMLELAPPQGPDLLQLLDHSARELPSGMSDSEPLPALLAQSLGRSRDLAALAELPLGAKLRVLDERSIEARIRTLGAAAVLDIADHRAQGEWLLAQEELDWSVRSELFDLLLAAEHFEQMREWELLGPALDRAVKAALAASQSYPDTPRGRAAVSRAFHSALAE